MTVGSSTYDALNHRVEYVTGGTQTYYAFNLAGQRVGTYDSTLTQQLEEVYWGSEPVAFLNSSNQMNFHFQDYIGSARLDWLGQGMPGTVYGDIWRPFGDGFATINGGPDQDQYHFAGLDADPDGTDHAQFRNYQPITGQWLSPDPYMGSYSAKNPQSFNRYAYVKNNPLRFTDPLGLTEQICSTGTDDDGNEYSYCTEDDSGSNDGDSDSGNPYDTAGNDPGEGVDGIGGFAGPDSVPVNTTKFILYIDTNLLTMNIGMIPPGMILMLPQNNKPTVTGGGGGLSSTDIQQMKLKIIRGICDSSAEKEVLHSMEQGALEGGIGGAAEGGFGGAFFDGVGAIPGAILGGWVGGVVGAMNGIVEGSETALACYLGKAY